jgi:hypothetical protein
MKHWSLEVLIRQRRQREPGELTGSIEQREAERVGPLLNYAPRLAGGTMPFKRR